MTIRTTQTTVHFSSPFRLQGLDSAQPAGDYRVDYDEELVEGLSLLAWRQVGAFLHLPGIGRPATRFQIVPIDSADLKSALERDLGS
ncbi:hypothetical protein [Mesorhizobium australicum]|uniref:Uncharacterized protein n=1 Tax=Mesorhizobium australicum TaxID=536018 RepID=A0A1X7PS00_9HYPH|nr:hypothetical protein [Mesorhizobium australicum]SMH54802.1 hypothetical protein SAMN02982922_5219 [Mesorhizobium australicum]